MDLDLVVIAVIALAALASVFFTVVPIVPGTVFVPIGALVCGFVAGWNGLGWWFWIAQAVLVGVYLLVDNVAQVLGVRRLGGSRAAMVGGTIGVFVGPIVLGLVLGPLALFVGPPIGAVVGTIIGESRARRRSIEGAEVVPGQPRATYARLGTGALVAFIVGTTAKLVLVTVQVALLVWVV